MASRNNETPNRGLQMVGPVETDSSNETNQPRQPQNLQDLLRYAVEAGSSGNTRPNAANHSLECERRQFLEEALSSMTLNVIQELTDALQVLHPITIGKGVEEDSSKYCAALETILQLVDNIDVANDFDKVGGLDTMVSCLELTDSEVRWRAAEVLAVCTQNNTHCQQAALSRDLLPKLMDLAEHDPLEVVKIKSFYAVACLIRDFDPAISRFMVLDGFSFLIRIIRLNIDKLRVKAIFLVSSLCSYHQKIKDVLVQMGFVTELISLLEIPHTRTHEFILSSLMGLLRDNPAAQREARSLNIRPILLNIKEEYCSDDAYQEEMAYINEILDLAYSAAVEPER